MATENNNNNDGSANSGQETGNNNQNSNSANVDANNSENSGIDAAFAKHLDIAIEAQDGKPKEKQDENANAETDADAESSTEQQSKDSKSGTGDNGAQKKPSEEASEAGRTLARSKDLKLSDGSVIKGGAERRFYEQRENARQEAQTAKQELASFHQKYKQLEQELNTTKQSVESVRGVDPETLQIGARVVGDLQRDPVGTLKKLLAEVAAKGYNLDDIGVGVDTAAIQRMIDERLPKPSETKTEEDYVNDAKAEVTAFFGRFPDAKPHEPLIAAALRDHTDLTLQDAYFQLKNAFAEKGFDWSRTLEDNLKDASNLDNRSEQNQNNNSNSGKPLPNGRGGSDGDFKLNNNSGVAHEDLDTGDIVRQAMRENGLNI